MPRTLWRTAAPLAMALAFATGPLAAQAFPDSLVNRPAPDSFLVSFETTKGAFLVKAHRDWSPLGVDRFYHLVRLHVLDGVVMYRVVPNYFVQFGLTNDPQVNAAWTRIPIPDEPVKVSNTKGRIHFARSGPGTRSNQLSIMRKDNAYLDTIEAGSVVGFPPIAEIVEGIEVIDALNERYGNDPATHQDSIRAKGREYLDRVYPGLDVILRVRLVEAPEGAQAPQRIAAFSGRPMSGGSRDQPHPSRRRVLVEVIGRDATWSSAQPEARCRPRDSGSSGSHRRCADCCRG
jgi:peptidyl-prolyl cis-trans isomerase A (cyclophilin A)